MESSLTPMLLVIVFYRTFKALPDSLEAALDVDVKIEVIVDLFAKITVVLKACIEDIKVLAKLKFEDIICDSNGVALSVTVIAGFCIKLILVSLADWFPVALADICGL